MTAYHDEHENMLATPVPEEPSAEQFARQRTALRYIQLKAGEQLTQLTSNHPWYAVFEEMHRVSAQAQLSSLEVQNHRSPEVQKAIARNEAKIANYVKSALSDTKGDRHET